MAELIAKIVKASSSSGSCFCSCQTHSGAISGSGALSTSQNLTTSSNSNTNSNTYLSRNVSVNTTPSHHFKFITHKFHPSINRIRSSWPIAHWHLPHRHSKKQQETEQVIDVERGGAPIQHHQSLPRLEQPDMATPSTLAMPGSGGINSPDLELGLMSYCNSGDMTIVPTNDSDQMEKIEQIKETTEDA